jgi:acyl-CoA synthetase (NDP forming)
MATGKKAAPDDILREALAKGQAALSEHEAKQFLSCYGIPVNREALAYTPEGAVAEAESLGFPVVLKACGPGLTHKTELGGVVLNLGTAEQVRQAGERLLSLAGCEALLVQEMVRGERELVCGLTRDAQFGPCVMFGLGGIFTETLEDITFRLAPLSPGEDREMARELHAPKILGPFRGQPAADLEALAHIQVALGQIALRHREVLEIDLNPLKIQPDGQPVAVDALIILANPMDQPVVADSPPEKAKDLTRFFEPRSVAIVGASTSPGKPGHEVIRNILANGYQGRVYLINPNTTEILGLPVWPSLDSLPEAPDLAVIILPAARCPQALRDCAAKGIKHIVISAGGFAEVDEARGKIQRQLIGVIRENDLSVLGPNTSGHTSTPYNFTSTFFPLGRIRRGKVSYIAQTGNFATHTMKHILTAENFGVARVIGLGNAIDIDESVALEYLAGDPETEAVLMYLEGFKRPRRFLEIARELTRRKPVILLKGGATEAGRQAAVAHTASLAGEDRLVEGMLRQAGVVRIRDYTHLILAGKGLSMMPLPRGNRVSFLAPSGAMLVVLTDLCTRLNLEVPALEPQNLKRLEEISPPFIRMRNPVDIWAAASTRGVEFGYREGLEAVLRDANIDAVVVVLLLTAETGIPSLDFLVELAQQYPDKPVFVTYTGDKKYEDACRDFLEPKGVPTFPEIEQPFEVLAIMARCHRAMGRLR